MKKQCFIFSLLLSFSFSKAFEIAYQNIGFVNIKTIKKEALIIKELKDNLKRTKEDLYKERDKYLAQQKELRRKLNNNEITKAYYESENKMIIEAIAEIPLLILHANELFDCVVEEKIRQATSEVAKILELNSILPTELTVYYNSKFDITNTVIKKMDIILWQSNTQQILEDKNGK